MVIVVRSAADAVASIRIASAGAFSALVEREDERAVGKPAVEREGVDLAHRLNAESPCTPLIRERTVHEPVGDHPLPDFERRTDRLFDMIGARRREQQCFGPRSPSFVVTAEQQLANSLCPGAATWLAGRD